MKTSRLTTISLAAIVSMAVFTTSVHGKSFDFDTIDVVMDVQADGRIKVTETWDCILDGDINGGYRTINMKGIGDITDIALTEDQKHAYRIFSSEDDEATIPKRQCRVIRGWKECEIKWRSRKVSEPEYQSSKVRFTLKYTLHGAIWRYWRVDKLYYKAIFEERMGPVAHGRCLVRLPASPKNFGVTFYCESPDAKWVKNESSPSIEFTASNIAPGELFEVEIEMPKGIVEGQASLTDLLSGGLGVGLFLGGSLLGVVVTWSRWRRNGCDPEPTISVHYQDCPPDDLKPGIAAALINEKADIPTVTATMLDLARRGVLSIEQLDDGWSPDYRFTLERFDENELDPIEMELLQGLYDDRLTPGETRDLSSLRNKFYKTASKIQSQVFKAILDMDFFKSHPTKVVAINVLAGLAMCAIGVALMGLSNSDAIFSCAFGFMFGGIPLAIFVGGRKTGGSLFGKLAACLFITPFVAIGGFMLINGLFFAWEGTQPAFHIPGMVLLIWGVLTFITARAMVCKTQHGANVASAWRRFAEFLSMDAASQSASLTADQLGDYLPFAVALGVEQQWTSRFEKFAVSDTPFTYYRPFYSSDIRHGQASGFGDLGASLNSMISSVSSTFSSRPSSSGSSGGGSSGGGGGGGGGSGGGW